MNYLQNRVCCVSIGIMTDNSVLLIRPCRITRSNYHFSVALIIMDRFCSIALCIKWLLLFRSKYGIFKSDVCAVIVSPPFSPISTSCFFFHCRKPLSVTDVSKLWSIYIKSIPSNTISVSTMILKLLFVPSGLHAL